MSNRKPPSRASGLTVAIDGPAGAGKTTAARQLARVLGLRYVDTGAMYRGLAWAALRAGVPPDHRRRVTSLLSRLRLTLSEDRIPRLRVNGVDVSTFIRTPAVSQAASRMATVPEVRTFLVRAQRRLAREGGVVMEGRDIGTVVLPRAEVKFFLDASVEERALRRWKEVRAAGKAGSLRSIERAIRERDFRDRSRAVSPLRAAPDAVVVDTTGLPLPRVIRILADWVRRKSP